MPSWIGVTAGSSVGWPVEKLYDRPTASNALTYAAIVASEGRVTALAPATGAVRADVRTDAKVFAVGANGMILVSGRDMAYLPFA